MTEHVPFGLASRITKPIPLAALCVLALTSIALAIVRVGEVHVGMIGYAIIAAMSIIALVALVLAIAKPQQATSAMLTKGDYSPGDVGRDYLVSGHLDPPSQKTRNSTGKPAPPNASQTIVTEGSYSPGRVGGDYTVQDTSRESRPRSK
jgi:hypothetical protein